MLVRLRDLIEQAGCPLLAGASMPSGQVDVRCPDCGHRWQVGEGLLGPAVTCTACGEAFPPDGHFQHVPANSAVMFDLDEQGQLRLRDRYDKIHLVPFSECVPFRQGWRWFHDQLRRCVPEPMNQLEPGRHRVWFEIDSAGGRTELAVPICYEGTFARVCRRLVMHNGRKCCQLLVNISNDGWFIRKYADGRKVHASTELAQHLVQYVFRAVENRLHVVRAVNTGISAHVDSNGVIRQTVSNEGRREMAVGNLEVETLVDARTSSYSKHGDIFALLVCVASGGILVKVFWRRQGRDFKKE